MKTDGQKKVVKDIIKKYHSYVPTADYPGRRIDWLIHDVINDDTPVFDNTTTGQTLDRRDLFKDFK